MKTLGLNFFLLLILVQLNAQVIHDLNQSVMIDAEISELSQAIQLRWVADDNAQSYLVYRKSPQSNFWGTPIANLPSDSLNWTDQNVESGIIYEYRVEKVFSGQNSNGYIYSGITLAPIHYNGLCIVVIDSFYKQSLEFEINRFKNDLRKEGWLVKPIYCSEDDLPPVIRGQIIELYQEYPSQPLYTVFLFGRVPIPYSGNIAPDGHPDHQGAWPADGYYGSVSGNWTDQSVNITVASDPRNHNVPGDGKFDQSEFPGLLQLAVGRVDFRDLPSLFKSEEELLKNYLDKNHRWRKGNIPTNEKGLVQNNFPTLAEGFGQNGYKNFSTMFGNENVHSVPYRTTLINQAYLWSYGAGSGHPSGASGIVGLSNLNSDSLQTVFTMVFGSYFGDWGYRNNLLRAVLASGTVLTNVWAGRPNWQFHHMAMGKPIGYSVLKSKNNNSVYQTGLGKRGVHMALMGDPTLFMYISRPPEHIQISQLNTTLEINWSKVPDAEGYYLYYRPEGEDIFTLIRDEITADTFFVLNCPLPGMVEYMVRASELKITASGSFFHLSPGTSIYYEAAIDDFLPLSEFSLDITFDLLSLENNSQGATHYFWHFGDGNTDSLESPVHLFEDSGIYEVCLYTYNDCYSDFQCIEIEIINSMPAVDTDILHISCYGESDGQIAANLSGGAADPELLWSNGEGVNEINNLSAGIYSLTISTITGKVAEFGPWEIIEPDSLSIEFSVVYPDDSDANGSISAEVSGGTTPYQYLWSTSDSTKAIENLSAGQYCLTITDHNGCEKQACYLLQPTSLIEGEEKNYLFVFPNPATDEVIIQISSPIEKSAAIKILDAGGRLVKTVNQNNGAALLKINIGDLPAGTYYISLEIEGVYWIYPLTKM